MAAKTKILIVDDEEGFTRLLKMNLEDTGFFEVRVENNGLKAFDGVKFFKPDIILLDVIMPDISGLEVSAKLRQNPETSSIPIVFLTAAVSREEVASQGGVIDGHMSLAKPTSVDDVVRAIKESLANA